MPNAVEDFVRNVTTGVGINSATVDLKKHSDDTIVASKTTAGTGHDAGKFAMTEAEVGYPGQTYLVETSTGSTREHSSKSIGQVGPLRAIDLTYLIKLLGDGIVDELGSSGTSFKVTATGANMDVSIATGFALGAGQTYNKGAVQTKTITASDPTNPRIDLVVIRFFPIGATAPNDVGRVDLVVIAGTPTVTPVAPVVTQTTALWEERLAEVLVGAGVTTIAQGNITDRRRYVQTDIPIGTGGQYLKLNNGVPTWSTLVTANVGGFDEAVEDKIGTKVIAGAGITVTYDDPGTGNTTITNTAGGAGTIAVQEGDVTVDGTVTTLDFDASDFNVTSSPAGEANVALAYGKVAGTPAEGSHTHTRPISKRGNLSRDEVANGLANVTSTSGQHASTGFFADLPLDNGVIYDITVNGTASIEAPTDDFIYMAAIVDSTGVLGSPIISAFNGEGTETATKPHGAGLATAVTGNGQNVRCGLWFKVGSGTGFVGSGAGSVMAIPRASGAVD